MTTVEKLARDFENHLNFEHVHTTEALKLTATKQSVEELADRIKVLDTELQELRGVVKRIQETRV